MPKKLSVEEARHIAELVISGHTPSYVRSARLLSEFILLQFPAAASDDGGEAQDPTRPDDIVR
jgi:hypothetical protein